MLIGFLGTPSLCLRLMYFRVSNRNDLIALKSRQEKGNSQFLLSEVTHTKFQSDVFILRLC